MAPDLVVLRLKQGRVLDARRYVDGHVEAVAVVHRKPSRELAHLCDRYPHANMAWYEAELESQLSDVSTWPMLLRHSLEVLHLSAFQRCERMVKSLGYVDFDSPFLLPGPRDRRFVSWLVSPIAGIGSATLIRAIGLDTSYSTFAATLFDFGYRGFGHGLSAYSEPALLQSNAAAQMPEGKSLDNAEMARLIRNLYGPKWVVFWIAAHVFYRKQPPVSAVRFLRGARSHAIANGRMIEMLHHRLASMESGPADVSVVIPTLGRPGHLINVLKDLAEQTLVPSRVVVVEQLPTGATVEELPDISSQEWPFRVIHLRVDSLGACRARNLALEHTAGEWVLMLDDDVRLTRDSVRYLVDTACAYSVDAVNAFVYKPGENSRSASPHTHVWQTFGAGAALVSRSLVVDLNGFDEALDGGYGEDIEYGLRLRLHGGNILYASREPVLHLKAPAGGFRFSKRYPWDDSAVRPAPSPYILYMRQKHATTQMVRGYRLFYTLNKLSSILPHRWPGEVATINRRWRESERWVQRMRTESKPLVSVSTSAPGVQAPAIQT